MALEVKWSPLAQKKRKEILEYWQERNGNRTYSFKLNSLFIEGIKQLTKFPYIGRKSDVEGVRIKIVRDYLLFYEIYDNTIYILTIWDSRQDPEELRLKL